MTDSTNADPHRVTLREARELICPILRPDDAEFGTCQGDACMLWRWHRGDLTAPTHGYCGLAEHHYDTTRR